MKWETVEDNAIEYFKLHDDEYVTCLNELDGWNGYIHDRSDVHYENMDFFNDYFYGTRDILGEILVNLDRDFDPRDNYWYFDSWGNISSTNDPDYSDLLDGYFIEELYDTLGHIDLPDYIEKLFDAYANDEDENEDEEDEI